MEGKVKREHALVVIDNRLSELYMFITQEGSESGVRTALYKLGYEPPTLVKEYLNHEEWMILRRNLHYLDNSILTFLLNKLLMLEQGTCEVVNELETDGVPE